MPKYTVGVVWMMSGYYEVEAENEEEAKKATYPLDIPRNGELISDSFNIESVEEIQNDWPETE